MYIMVSLKLVFLLKDINRELCFNIQPKQILIKSMLQHNIIQMKTRHIIFQAQIVCFVQKINLLLCKLKLFIAF